MKGSGAAPQSASRPCGPVPCVVTTGFRRGGGAQRSFSVLFPNPDVAIKGKWTDRVQSLPSVRCRVVIPAPQKSLYQQSNCCLPRAALGPQGNLPALSLCAEPSLRSRGAARSWLTVTLLWSAQVTVSSLQISFRMPSLPVCVESHLLRRQ